jgi:hypothetical protein
MNTNGSPSNKRKKRRKIETRCLLRQRSCTQKLCFDGLFTTQVFQQSLHSPDLAASDYFLFPQLKERLRGTHFSDDEEMMTFPMALKLLSIDIMLNE